MMRRSKIALSSGLTVISNEHKIDGFQDAASRRKMINAQHQPQFFVEQPYYLKGAPMNPAFGAVHDGVTTEYGKGYSVKPIHHLYRFSWNVLPTNIPRVGQISWFKRVHWLDQTSATHIKARWWYWEFLPPVALSIAVVLVITLHMIRFMFWSPDISWYNTAFPTNKNFVEFLRFNSPINLDQPVVRYMNQTGEFYALNHEKRGMIKLDLIHNDPYINHVKAVGRGDELLATTAPFAPPHEYKQRGSNDGFGHLNPSVLKEKSEWWTPASAQAEQNYEKYWKENNAGKGWIWTFYTNLIRY